MEAWALTRSSYEMRREAQEIVPGLLLGAYNAATNADRLAEAGITHLYVALHAYSKSFLF